MTAELWGNPQENPAVTPGPGDVVSQVPDQPGDEESFTYHHARYEGGRHWFSAEHDGAEVGHAYVIEQQGPGGPHAEIKRLRTDPDYRGRGIGSRLLDNVGEHFTGQELCLKPYPIDEDSGQDESDLREYYRNRGFADYELKEGDLSELYDYMTKRALSGPAAEPAEALYVSPPGPAIAGAWSPLSGWAADQPHKAAIRLAQDRLREERPELTGRLEEPEEFSPLGTSYGGGRLLRKMLAAGGYPAEQARKAFVLQHDDPEHHASNVAAMGSAIGARLHRARFDVGTLAHEAGHILHIHQAGWDPSEKHTDKEIHGPDFARHYATALNAACPGSGDHFLRYHRDALILVSNYRKRVHGLPPVTTAATQRAARGELPPAAATSPDPARGSRGPQPKMAAGRVLPGARGLWYRVHPADNLDLDQGKARSRSLETPGIGQPGLSAFASPHHLYSYITETDWGGRGWLHGHDDGATVRRVVAFHGHEVGRGDDDEPLIRPEPDASCCGQVVHSHLAWTTFVRKLSGTPQPRTRWSPGQARENARRRASGERGQHRRPAATPVYLHGGPNCVEPGAVIHQDAMPESHGRLEHNFLTTSRQVAEDAADMRDGRGHGWIHTVKPTGPVAADHGEPQSWKSTAPLRVISVEPGHMNGTTPHPPILRQPKTASARDPYQTGLCGTYAVGLMRLRPDLRMGVAGDEKEDDDYLVPDHYFAHDDHYAYDSGGRHPLPYAGRWTHSQLDADDPWVLDAEHESHAEAEEAIATAQEHAIRHRVLEGGAPKTRSASTRRPASTAQQTGLQPGEHQLTVQDYEGRTGDPSHITRIERGLIPTAAIAHLRGARGEVPGEHRNRQGQRWADFTNRIAADGITNPIFITVDHGEEPVISEGSHRRDAAVEMGLPHVPAEIRYFGHAERAGPVHERPPRTAGVNGATPEDTACRHLPAPAHSGTHAAAAQPPDAPEYQAPAHSRADFPRPVHTRASRRPAGHVSQARRRAVPAIRGR